MMASDWVEVSLETARRGLKKEIYDVVEEWTGKGWRLREQGHKYALYCPCGRTWVRVDGTPRNPGSAARAIARSCSRCPQHPELP